jgi:hypothetical protein
MNKIETVYIKRINKLNQFKNLKLKNKFEFLTFSFNGVNVIILLLLIVIISSLYIFNVTISELTKKKNILT